MMFTPCGPRAVPTGGAGVAAPACSWTLTSAAIFFLGGIARVCPFPVVRRGHREPDRLCHLALPGAAGQPAHSPLSPARCEITSPPRLRASSRGFAAGRGSDLLDLAEAQLDRGLPAEDLDQRLDPLGLGVDLGD